MKCRIILLCLVCLMTTWSCKDVLQQDDDKVLARVYQKKLYESDLEGVVSGATTAEDSLILTRSYVESWVRDALLLKEAESKLPPDLNIDKLVENYHASLILHNYENHLVDKLVDSHISSEELSNYYEENKEQYQLETTIVRCHFLKITKPVPNRDSLRNWWDDDSPKSFEKLVKYSNQNADLFILDSVWYKVEEIEQFMPSGTISQENIRSANTLRFTDPNYEYYLRVLETVKGKEIAPLSYIREQAIRVIMHERKLETLERIKNDLYREELERNNVKINI